MAEISPITIMIKPRLGHLINVNGMNGMVVTS